MSKKTNKTSHVMDLLTNGAPPEPETPAAEAPQAQDKKASDIQTHTATPAKVTIVDEGSRNDRLSQEILGKLTEELEEETRQEQQARKEDSKKQDAATAPVPDQEASGSAVENPPETAAPKQEADSQETVASKAAAPEPDIPEAAAQSLQAPEAAGETAAKTAADESAPDTMEVPAQPLEDGKQDHEAGPESPAPSAPEASQAAQEAPIAAPPREEPSQSTPAPANPAKEPGPAKPDSSQAPTPEKKAGTAGNHPRSIIPESQLNNRFQDKEYRFINVMEQLLMRQNLEAVLTQYEVCTCPRCMSDVCALVLTGLPSKYVVTSKDSISPLISYYENKYKIPVLTELMKACNKVRQNPRHKVSK